MKKFIASCLSAIALTANATSVELVNKDGYLPLFINPRVVFFVEKEYTDDKTLPKGTHALFIVTVDCSNMTHRRTVTEIFNSNNGRIMQLYKKDSDVSERMTAMSFTPIDPELVPIATNLCNQMK